MIKARERTSRAFSCLGGFPERFVRFDFELRRWLVPADLFQGQRRCRANIYASGALKAVPVAKVASRFVFCDLVSHRATLLTNAATAATFSDGELVFIAAGQVAHGTDRTDGAPGAGAVAKTHGHGCCGGDQAHLPENHSPVLQAGRVLCQAIGHKAHQPQHNQRAQFHAEQLSWDWSCGAEFGEKGVKETATRAEIAADITAAQSTS